jgi:phosphoribosyl 1,2-cyclic phosphodiesterase
LQLTQHYSSSSGNLYELKSLSGERLLIDPGVTFKKLQKALDYNFDNIVGCLITHGHYTDHCRGVKDIIKSGIEVYASAGTIEELDIPKKHKERMIPIEAQKKYTNDCFEFMPFNVEHDAQEPFGFVIKCDDEYMLFATDTMFIPSKFDLPFSIIALEVSYSLLVLKNRVEEGFIEESVAKRLLESHQEIRTAIHYLKTCCNLNRCKELHLLHLSRSNQILSETRELFEREFSPIKIVICEE